MKSIMILTHGGALLLGLGIAASIHEKPSEVERAVASPAGFVSAKISERPQTISDEQFLRALATIKTNDGARKLCRREILDEWALKDPFGLLDYLLARPWDPYDDFSSSKMFATLAREQPEALMEYVMLTGCRHSLKALASEGNPDERLERFLRLGEDRIPPWLIRNLFADVCKSQPDFMSRLDRISNRELRMAALDAIAANLMQSNQFPEAAALAMSLSHEEQGIIVREMASGFSDDYSRPQLLMELPDAIRGEVLEAILDTSNFDPVRSNSDDINIHSLLTSMQDEQLLESHIDAAISTLMRNNDGVDPANAEPEELKQARLVEERWQSWARSLPDTDEWMDVKLAALIRSNTTQSMNWRSLLNIKNDELRNRALANFAIHADKVISPAIVSQINDPMIRAAVLESQIVQGEYIGDPFAYPGSSYDKPEPWLPKIFQNDEPFDPFAPPGGE